MDDTQATASRGTEHPDMLWHSYHHSNAGQPLQPSAMHLSHSSAPMAPTHYHGRSASRGFPDMPASPHLSMQVLPPIYAERVLCSFEVVYDLNPYEESDLMHRRKAGSIPTFCLPLKSFIVSLHPSVAPFPLSPTLSRPFLHALCLRHSLARTRTHPHSSTRAVQTNMFLCTNTPGSRICCPGRRGLPATAAAAAAVF